MSWFRTTIEDRFNRSIKKTENGCWEWTGNLSTGGYAEFYFNGRLVFVHRWAYERFVGKIPKGLTIDHLCKNRACQNPKHMEVVTLKENIRRGDSPSSRNREKTHCKNGHPFDSENTGHSEPGRRHCKLCMSFGQAKFKIKKGIWKIVGKDEETGMFVIKKRREQISLLPQNFVCRS